MRIDASHRPWATATALVFSVAVLLYLPYAFYTPGGAGGNTWPGLIYGLLGYSMMLYAGLMGARKKRPLWRVGRAQVWMRGHLWMGLLSFPMIVLHSAFHARGPLTILLMTLLTVTVLSGITGALLQHFVPKRLTASVQFETIYEQIPEVREQLREEASGIIEQLCFNHGSEVGAIAAVIAGPGSGVAGLRDTGLTDEGLREFGVAAFAAGAASVAAEPEALDLNDDQRNNLRQVYTNGILPFLRDPGNHNLPLANAVTAKSFFDALRHQMPALSHEAITDLEGICEEERQLTVQRRRYLMLHSWLLVHVPLSITLLVLGAVHAFVAIHY